MANHLLGFEGKAGLWIYHVGFVRSANYFFQRLQGFTPAGAAASRAPALPPRSRGLLVPSTMCDGALLPPLVLPLLLLLFWGLDPGTGSAPFHLPSSPPPSLCPSEASARPECSGWTADRVPGEGGTGRRGGPGSGQLLAAPGRAHRRRFSARPYRGAVSGGAGRPRGRPSSTGGGRTGGWPARRCQDKLREGSAGSRRCCALGGAASPELDPARGGRPAGGLAARLAPPR